jgi:hypothetical protein
LNTKGKDYTAKVLRFTIKNIFNTNMNTPITMNWKDEHEVSLSGNLDRTQTQTVLCPGKIISSTANLLSDGVDHSAPVMDVSDEENGKKKPT